MAVVAEAMKLNHDDVKSRSITVEIQIDAFSDTARKLTDAHINGLAVDLSAIGICGKFLVIKQQAERTENAMNVRFTLLDLDD